MKADRRRWGLRLAAFVLAVVAAGWPYPALQLGFSRALSAIGNGCLGSLEVGAGAQVQLVPLLAPGERTPDQNVREDTHLVLRVAGHSGEGRVGISLRRDAYLPLVIFVAAIAVWPLRRRARLACLGLGVSIILGAAIASVALLALFLASSAPALAVPRWQAQLASFLFECWLTPPGNRVIAPLLLAAGLALAASHSRRLSGPGASGAAARRGAGATS